ncbi:MAG: DUF2459 domain-containing protein [Planctomycetaceae bacterium]|nr:DUF2459 domain-containing protein [Planctomycetaceae bacterium]
MISTRYGLLALALVCSLSGCKIFHYTPAWRAQTPVEFASHTESSQATVFLVGHGWHTGLVLPVNNIDRGNFPEAKDFQEADFIEVGWGDEGFYRATKMTPTIITKAAFWPTPSVMHVAGFRGPVRNFFPYSDIHEVKLSVEEFDALCRFISNSFEHDDQGNAIDLGEGLYGQSRFYRAKGEYYMPKTCNIWTAKALREAGLPITVQTAITAENVLGQSRKWNRVLQESPKGIKKAAFEGSSLEE